MTDQGWTRGDWERLGERLREERAGRPRDLVVKLAGVSRAQIQRYEEGRVHPDIPDKLYRLARFYGWTPGSLRSVLEGGDPEYGAQRDDDEMAAIKARLDTLERHVGLTNSEALVPTRSCCVCGARGGLRRYRAAEIRGGPAQWVCSDVDACASRVEDIEDRLSVHERDGVTISLDALKAELGLDDEGGGPNG